MQNLKNHDSQDTLTKTKKIKPAFMVYGDLMDFRRRAGAYKVLHDKAISIAKNSASDGYQREFDSMVYYFFDKYSSGANTWGGAIKNEVVRNQELTEELHNSFIRKFEKRKVYSSCKDIIWAADLEYLQSIAKCNTGIRFLLGVTDASSQKTWTVSLKDKRCVTITNSFQKYFIRVL